MIEQSPTSWLGFTPASEQELASLEGRIERKLPWSYRELLSATNGFIRLSSTIGALLRASKVDLYSRRDPDTVALLASNWHPSYLATNTYRLYDPSTRQAPTMDYHGDHLSEVVQITEEEDEIIVLLDPLIEDENGEWEAWYFGPGRIQGAFRYQTFPDLVEDRLRLMRQESRR
jgi:hypothetical protein